MDWIAEGGASASYYPYKDDNHQKQSSVAATAVYTDRPCELIQQAGEVLYVPRHWTHQVGLYCCMIIDGAAVLAVDGVTTYHYTPLLLILLLLLLLLLQPLLLIVMLLLQQPLLLLLQYYYYYSIYYSVIVT